MMVLSFALKHQKSLNVFLKKKGSGSIFSKRFVSESQTFDFEGSFFLFDPRAKKKVLSVSC